MNGAKTLPYITSEPGPMSCNGLVAFMASWRDHQRRVRGFQGFKNAKVLRFQVSNLADMSFATSYRKEKMLGKLGNCSP
eukprot:s2673_g4.t1